MKVTILIFARLQDQLGINQDTLDVAAQETAENIFQRLQEKHQCTLSKQGVRVAINQEFANWSTTVADGDEVAFIPPVAGG